VFNGKVGRSFSFVGETEEHKDKCQGERITTSASTHCTKRLVKWTPAGVNFINIIFASFSYESVLPSFSLVTVWLCIFWCKTIGAKADRKMLMKLTTANIFNRLLISLFDGLKFEHRTLYCCLVC